VPTSPQLVCSTAAFAEGWSLKEIGKFTRGLSSLLPAETERRGPCGREFLEVGLRQQVTTGRAAPEPIWVLGTVRVRL